MLLSKCGEYYYVYFENPTTRKRTKISTRSKKKRDAYLFLMNFNPNSTINYRNISLSEFSDKILNYVKIHYSNGTFCLYERSMRHLNTQVNNIPLQNLSQCHIETYKVYRIERNASRSTVNMEFRALRSMFNFATKWGLIGMNPCLGVKQFKIPQKEILAFSEVEVVKLLEQIVKQSLKDFVLFALLTGCRLNEITQLQWRDIDLNNNTITIHNKPDFKTKSGRIRVLPISEKLMYLINRLRIDNNLNENTYVFHNSRGIRLEGNYISGLFKKELRRLNFPERFHFHCLRHTFISRLAKKGVNIYDIKQLAGHVDIETTELYMHNITDDLRTAVNLI